MHRNEMLKKLQSYQFAMYDMLLYLDTHPEDQKAFSLYQELAAQTKKSMSEFEKNYGPLNIASAADTENFCWQKSPWSWEKEAD